MFKHARGSGDPELNIRKRRRRGRKAGPSAKIVREVQEADAKREEERRVASAERKEKRRALAAEQEKKGLV